MAEEAGEVRQAGGVEDVGETRNAELLDSENKIRRWCLIKGYTGLLCHLLTITAIILIFMYCVPVTDVIYSHRYVAFWILLVMTVLSLVLITVTCLRQAAYPVNLVALFILTACVGVLLGVAYSIYQCYEFVRASSIAAATILVLLLYSLQSKLDFTVFRGVLLVVLTDLIIFGILVLALPRTFVTSLYSVLAVLPFLLYIVYDSHLVITGRPSRSLLKNTTNFSFSWILLVMTVLSLVLITVTCLRQAAYPVNLVALFILTACVGVLLGVAYSIYQCYEFVRASSIAAATILVLLLYSLQSKLDFTVFRGVLLVVLTDLIIFDEEPYEAWLPPPPRGGVPPLGDGSDIDQSAYTLRWSDHFTARCCILVLALPRTFVTSLYSVLAVLPFLLYIVYDSHLVITGRPSRSLLKNVYALP